MINILDGNNDIKLRKGIIYITWDIFKELDRYHKMMSLVFSKFIPREATPCYDINRHMYMGYCEDFDICPEGTHVPVYDVTCHSVNGDIYNITFEKSSESYNLYHSEELIPEKLFNIS